MIGFRNQLNENLDDSGRVGNLNSYMILDTECEKDFDILVRVASEWCQAPMALVSLVDQRRLWFKAKLGTEVSELDRAESFCSSVVDQNEALWVSDASTHPRFSTHPLVVGPSQIRFYGGVPLITREGFSIGTLCILDKIPRPFDQNQMRSLEMLGAQVVSLFERNRYRREKEALEKKLLESMKLATLGTLSASIIHEINNPLTVLQGRAQILSKMATEGRSSPQNTAESTEKMLQSLSRINKIIAGLGRFIGNQLEVSSEKISLKDLIDETLSFTEARFMSGQIEFHYIPPEGSVTVFCNPVQISQVLVNLLSNAYDAVMEHPSRRKWVKLKVSELKDTIEFSVVDSGKPVSEELAKKIFAPFFSTKGTGKGTGLGLSISEEIVKAHGGELKLDASKRNTTFVVSLPRAGRSSFS